MKKILVLMVSFIFTAALAFAGSAPKGTGLEVEGGGGGFSGEFKVLKADGNKVTIAVPTHKQQVAKEGTNLKNLKLFASYTYYSKEKEKWILIPQEYEAYAVPTQLQADGTLIGDLTFPDKGAEWYSPRIWIDDISNDGWGWIDQSSPYNRLNEAKKPSYEFVYHLPTGKVEMIDGQPVRK
jgi:hypothetical protein